MAYVKTVLQLDEGDEDEKGNVAYRRRYRVFFNNMGNTALDAITWGAIPARKSLYPGDPFARVVRRRIGQHKIGCIYDIDVEYSTETEEFENPLDEPAQISWGFETYQKIVEKDLETGEPIVNSAGEPFENSVVADAHRSLLLVTKNYPSFSQGVADYYSDTINQSAWNGYAAGSVKCNLMTANREIAKVDNRQIAYWVVSIEFAIDRDGWNARPQDKGYKQLVDGEWEPFMIGDVPTQQAVLLNGEGQPLPVPVAAEDVHYFDFNIYPKRNFAFFNQFIT